MDRSTRGRLGRLVFGPSDEHRDRLSRLESILHPGIRKEFQQTINATRESGAADAVLLDAAVLLESGWRTLCDAVVFVDVPLAERLRRVTETRGWTEDELRRREASQLAVDDKRERSDHVIDTFGQRRGRGNSV